MGQLPIFADQAIAVARWYLLPFSTAMSGRFPRSRAECFGPGALLSHATAGVSSILCETFVSKDSDKPHENNA